MAERTVYAKLVKAEKGMADDGDGKGWGSRNLEPHGGGELLRLLRAAGGHLVFTLEAMGLGLQMRTV